MQGEALYLIAEKKSNRILMRRTPLWKVLDEVQKRKAPASAPFGGAQHPLLKRLLEDAGKSFPRMQGEGG
jgi:hypothetical protein